MTAPKNNNTVAALSTKLSPALSIEDRTKQIKALEYIIQTAGLTNTDISKWKIFDLFSSAPGTIVLDKTEINKRFFAQVKPSNVVPTEAITSALNSPALLADLGRFGEDFLRHHKRNLESNLEYAVECLQSAFQAAYTKQHTVVECRVLLDAFSGINPSERLKKELEEVLAEGSWTNLVSKDGFLYLNTKNNVVINLKNKQATLDIQVDCGQLAVKIELRNLNMMVIPYKNNVGVDGYYHPHVESNGYICWGDAGRQVALWVKEYKLSSILKMLYALLFNYNDGNPYVSIQYFSQHGKKFTTQKTALKHPDKIKEPEV